MPNILKNILILGGTGEARELAQRIHTSIGKRVKITSSLVGMRSKPPILPGKVRYGGFGGVPGLTSYLSKKNIDMVIDATHPFSKNISKNATIACGDSKNGGIPRLLLTRALWNIPPSAKWIEVENLKTAANHLLGNSRRVFLTTGLRGLNNFSDCTDLWFLIRLIDQPVETLPLNDFKVIIGRPPYDLKQELSILSEHSIDTLVAKHAGGRATEAKILAASKAGVKIVLIRRPALEPGPLAETVDEALKWVKDRL